MDKVIEVLVGPGEGKVQLREFKVLFLIVGAVVVVEIDLLTLSPLVYPQLKMVNLGLLHRSKCFLK